MGTIKKVLLILGTLPLSSCFVVDDFGAYWNKAGIDQRLTGTWKIKTPIATGDRTTPLYIGGDTMRFAETNGAHELVGSEGKSAYPVKALTVGRYSFPAIAGLNDGHLIRYKVSGRVLEICNFYQDVIANFVKRNYPGVTSIVENDTEGAYMEIVLFDDQVFAVISKIPDSKAYWVCDAKYDRVP